MMPLWSPVRFALAAAGAWAAAAAAGAEAIDVNTRPSLGHPGASSGASEPSDRFADRARGIAEKNGASSGEWTRLRFNRQILPILSDACFHCHGPDAATREAKLRLDEREGLFRTREGVTVVAPGRPEASELILRISSREEDEVMPPRKASRQLQPAEIELLQRWVAAFLGDARPDAYERVVDRLLASPRYGERWAWDWLDAARYADTNGFQGDPERTMWPWRDWVVQARNANMPFDQFTIEQLAGDLLPGATREQKIASGFHRNTMFNGEGGRIAEETRVENVFDRVETTATIWPGLTFTCARCHDHKYDPVSQRDYYALFMPTTA